MAKALLTVLTGLSFLVFATSSVLFAKSFWRGDYVAWASQLGPNRSRIVRVMTGGGRCDFNYDFHDYDPGFPEEVHSGWYYEPSPAQPPTEESYYGWHTFSLLATGRTGASTDNYRGFGFWFQREQAGYAEMGLIYRRINFPLWVPAGLAAILPLWRAWRWLRQPRFRPGHCARCGYDLRASTCRCPECGTEILKTKETEIAAKSP